MENGAPAALLGLTDSHYRGFVRRDESWPEDSPEYRAGCSIEHRKRPPPEEIPGDVFDRQRVIPGFDQGLIERQVCLVLGTGGVGQNVALALARLGVARIVLVDRDIYDASNLTRQCLGSKADVGQRKVDVAARTLREYHNLRSEVEAVHCDALLEWPRVVSLAREATAVFNAIDAGVMWDFSLNSLCKELGLPLMAGQSFGWKFMAELYTGKAGEVCAFCYDSTVSLFQANEGQVSRRDGALQHLTAFLARSRGPPEGHPGDVSADELAAFLAEDEQFRCGGGALRDVVQSALGRAGLQALQGSSLQTDLLSFLSGLHQEVTARLLPGRISALPDVAFAPRPKPIDTRYVGSWVCPCLGCSVIMVSQWSALLTSQPPEGCDGQAAVPRNPPQAVTLNLDVGMTSEEQLGYELGALGVPLDRRERRLCRDPRREGCPVCDAAEAIAAEESLFVGRLPVVLAPVPGGVLPLPGSWREPPPEGSELRAAAVERALARRRPLVHLGEEYASAVIPALPALDWERSSASDAGPLVRTPELAVVPLLKVRSTSAAAASPSAMQGVASGVRSALVRARGRWWRLKGCGNLDEGFPARAVGDHGELSVRGCCFQHTADTELRMTAMAQEALAAADLDIANIPVGSYHYATAAGWPLPLVERHCALFETLGNARLGDHLLGGLFRLLPHAVRAPEGGFGTLRSALAAGRSADEADLWPTALVVSCGARTADALAQLEACSARLDEVPPPAAVAMGEAVPPELAGVWDAACGELALHLSEASARGSPGPSLLLWLAWRLGWECGAALRALHGAGISWGTYRDAMGIHCNAHTNNFVVKPAGSGRPTTFLAALDFDMAFTSHNHLPDAAGTDDTLGLDTWDGIQSFEATMGMKMVLSGSDFSSTGVENAAEVPASHSTVELAMRDTLVSAYDAAMSGSQDPHPHDQALHRAAYVLIKLALCLTTHVRG